MRLAFGTVAALLISAGAASAGPLSWNYTYQFRPAGGADHILLGTDTLYDYDHATGVETYTPVYFMLKNPELSGTGYADIGPSRLKYFNYWNLDITETNPENTVENRFELRYDFGDPVLGWGILTGEISAHGALTSSDGNFGIGLDPTDAHTIEVGGRKGQLKFEVDGSSEIMITLTPEPDIAPTPEPATLALAGLGIAGVLGARLRPARRLRTSRRPA